MKGAGRDPPAGRPVAAPIRPPGGAAAAPAKSAPAARPPEAGSRPRKPPRFFGVDRPQRLVILWLYRITA